MNDLKAAILERLDEIEKPHRPVEIPPCRVCGGSLSPASITYGHTKWAHQPPSPAQGGTPEQLATYCDGRDWGVHYSASQFDEWTGNREVVDLVAALCGEVERHETTSKGYCMACKDANRPCEALKSIAQHLGVEVEE